MTPAELLADMSVAMKLATAEGTLRDLHPLLPQKIAEMERNLAALTDPAEIAVLQHIIKIEKIIYFCANELVELEKQKPANMTEICRRKLLSSLP